MAQPTPYEIAYSFVGWQISNPARPLPADKLEVEFHALETTTDEILTNLALIQRDDGELANESVGYDQLSEELYAGFREPTVWLTSTAYVQYDAVFNGSSLYRCLTAHTSGTFATDLAAAKWELLMTVSGGGGGTWGSITGTLADQTDLQAALDAKQPLDAALTDLAGITFAQGDILYHNGTNVVALAAGVSGRFLKTQGAGANPLWDAIAGGGDLLAANNLSDLANAGTARTNLGLAIGTNVQAYDADLTTWAGLTPSANAQSFVTAADYAAMRVLLGLVIGTNVQAYDADLTTWAGLTPSANAQSLVTAADYAAMRVLLGLVIGTNVQAYDADLTTWAGLTPSANAQSLVTAADYAAMRALLDLEAGTDFNAYDATLAALAAYNTNGLLTQTAADTFAGRTITGTAGQITVTDGNGVAGNPTLSLPADVLIPTVLTVPNTGLHILDTNATHDLIIAAGSNLTADHTLTITTGDADRTLDISGASVTISAYAAAFLDDANEATLKATLNMEAGVDFQAYDADLTTWAGLTPSANAQSLVTAADYSAMRTLLSLVPGTNVQAYDADLATIAGLTATTDNFIQSKSNAWASRTPAQVMVDLHVTPTIAEKTSAGAYTMLAADDHILVNKTVGGATTVDLVTAVGRVRPVKIVDMKGDAATNNITIDGNGTETIVGLTTYLIRNNYGSTTLWPKPDGSGWYI